MDDITEKLDKTEQVERKKLTVEELAQKNRPVFNLFVMITIASLVSITLSLAHVVRSVFGF